MRTFWLVFLCLLAGVVCAQEPDPLGGFFRVTHGYVRQPDGSMRNIAGLVIPYTVRPAPKSQWKGYQPSNFELGGNSDALQKVYDCDKPSNYFGGVGAGPMPTALDDILTTNVAIGKTWQRLKVGMHIPNRNQIPFIVWGAYDTFLGDMGPGNSCFSNIVVDSFGGPFYDHILNPGLFNQVPGDYVITFNIQAAAIVQTDEQIYFFQQFRNGSHTGPFLDDWWMFFSGGGPPQVGSSQDLFWYDYNPKNGVYAYDEIDMFNEQGQTGNEANFCLGIDVDSNSQVQELPAASVQVTQGQIESGNYLSTWSSNNGYFVVNSRNFASEDVYPIRMVYTTYAPSQTLTSLQVYVETSCDLPNQVQEVALYNFALNTWVTIDVSPTTTLDQTITKVMGINPSQYVKPGTLEMKLMLQARDNAAEVDLWKLKTDLIKWRVSYL